MHGQHRRHERTCLSFVGWNVNSGSLHPVAAVHPRRKLPGPVQAVPVHLDPPPTLPSHRNSAGSTLVAHGSGTAPLHGRGRGALPPSCHPRQRCPAGAPHECTALCDAGSCRPCRSSHHDDVFGSASTGLRSNCSVMPLAAGGSQGSRAVVPPTLLAAGAKANASFEGQQRSSSTASAAERQRQCCSCRAHSGP